MSELTLPKFGVTMQDATVVAWLKADGAIVTEGEDVVEIETDKAEVVLQAHESGRLRHLAKVGDLVNVGDGLAVVETAP
jgi:pyruvate/2-oxoglutarate dehydrogenase complex dihydrolipoamide acyltransferase (E2) component